MVSAPRAWLGVLAARIRIPETVRLTSSQSFDFRDEFPGTGTAVDGPLRLYPQSHDPSIDRGHVCVSHQARTKVASFSTTVPSPFNTLTLESFLKPPRAKSQTGTFGDG